MPERSAAPRRPDWLVKRLPVRAESPVPGLLDDLGLATVCRSARCPNLAECYARGTATFMILGERCTRDCRFCAVGGKAHKQGHTGLQEPEQSHPSRASLLRGPPGFDPPDPPDPPDHGEPARVAEAARRLGLRFVVVTSVTRDDLPDGGAAHFAATVRAIHGSGARASSFARPSPRLWAGSVALAKEVAKATEDSALRAYSAEAAARRRHSGFGASATSADLRQGYGRPPKLQRRRSAAKAGSPKGAKVGAEVLVPDFAGDADAVRTVCEAAPEVFGHNVETVPRLYHDVRPGAGYARSLAVLEEAARFGEAGVVTKSSLMVGLGETPEEVASVLRDLRSAGVETVTLGQYLRPDPSRAPVAEYVAPERFEEYSGLARELGFAAVAAGPFVRSSYRAEELWKERHINKDIQGAQDCRSLDNPVRPVHPC